LARIEDLVSEVADHRVRAALAIEVAALKRRRKFGLVYEAHIPETVLLTDCPIRVGQTVAERQDPTRRFRVCDIGIDGHSLKVEEIVAQADATSAARTPVIVDLDASNALVEKRFGEPIFPTLTSVGEVRQGDDKRAVHTVINGENLFALELLTFLYPGELDCIYIDPPFNTGARDWRYNNDYVDKNDTWRHSHWVAMMARRLRMAARLLKASGILVVAIDENEHASLTLLLTDIFPQCEITSVAIVQNPRGIQGDNFSFTNEFAVFVVPRGQKLIAKRPKDGDKVKGDPLRNWGGESLRTDAATCFYPIFVRDDVIVGFGDVADDEYHPAAANEPQEDGTIAVWPIGPDGEEHKWRYARDTVEGIRSQISVRKVRGRGPGNSLDIFLTKDVEPYRTIWTDAKYDANNYGTQMVTDMTGDEFSYPKSLYNVHDVLHAATGNRPDAVILDFFAGSGTTLQATCLLNSEDGGSRRCILVTNNEVEDKLAKKLNRAGSFVGDPAFEKHGIFEAITKPRVMAAIKGRRADDTALAGKYLGPAERLMAEGFPENVEFFRLDFLDADEVMVGLHFDAMQSVFWLDSGAVGRRTAVPQNVAFAAPIGVPYAYLFRASGLRDLLKVLDERRDITHVFVLTDSEDAYTSLCERLPKRIQTSMLYADYLRAFAGEWGGEP
jgi:adenine-specific DNA-methyltransferase